MNSKKLLYLSVTLLVLIILYFVSKTVSDPVQKTELLVDADTSKIDSIYIKSPSNGEVSFAKRSDAWRLVNPIDFTADERSIHTMLEKLQEMKIESIASTLPAKQADYKTADSAAVEVKFFAKGKKVGGFLMGNLSLATRRHTFFRRPGAKETLMVAGNYSYQFNRKLKDWRNKDIMTINPQGVKDIKFIYRDHNFTLALKDTIWMVDDGKTQFQATKNAVEPTLNYLTRLRAGDFFDMNSDTVKAPDFGNPEFRMEISFTDGNKDALTLVPENDEQKRFYIRKDTDKTIYVIYQGTAQVLMKDINDFKMRDANEPPQRPGKRNPRLNNG
jgi:hypothetical protein